MLNLKCRSQLAAVNVSLPNLEGFDMGSHTNLIPLLCSIFLANQGAGEATEVLSMVSKFVNSLNLLHLFVVERLRMNNVGWILKTNET